MIKCNTLSDGTNVVTIPVSYYETLLKDQELLEALQAAGVDNWAGYSDAIEMLEDEEDDLC